MQNIVDCVQVTERMCQRFLKDVQITETSDPEAAAARIRSLFIEVARSPEFQLEREVYPDDHGWIHDGICGVRLARIIDECALAANPVGPSGEEWGIMARISWGDEFFDIPIGLDLSQDTARNIMEHLAGREEEFVDTDLVMKFIGSEFSVQFHADFWARLREIAETGFIGMDRAFQFRRPAMWDVTRARLCDLAPPSWPEFDDTDFFRRYAMSMRFDAALAARNRRMLLDVSRAAPEAFSSDWLMWHQSIMSILASTGRPQALDGMSVILNFVCEEPGLEPESWAPVAPYNLAVAYGLHPLAAVQLIDDVSAYPWRYYDLPDEQYRRYRLMGAMVIQDASLSSFRVSTKGRTDAYERDRSAHALAA